MTDAYPQCPQGHDLAGNGAATKITPLGTRSLEAISGWIVIYCSRCGHIYQFAPPPKA